MDWLAERKYPMWAIAGFVILSVFGVTLRLLFVSPVPALNYSFLLHAHSHFAFAGWIFLALAILIIATLRPQSVSKPLNRTLILTLISAFGMLISFSFQGYKAISISFSTLFIVANFWFSYLIFRSRDLQSTFNGPARRLLKASLIFLCLSSAGPFALGPLMVTGHKDSPLYHNAIYFYLHFQMNGWMLMAALSLLLNRFTISEKSAEQLRRWLNAFIWSTVPLYLIFTLWSSSSDWVRSIALLAALLNLLSWIRILIFIGQWSARIPFLLRIAILALSIKILFQSLACIPSIGDWVFSQRNLIIGYIHLLTLGAITPLILNSSSERQYLQGRQLQNLHIAFVITVVLYLILLFIQPLLSLFQILIPGYQIVLLVFSVIFLILGCIYLRMIPSKRSRISSFANTTI
ncbi:hypothetical protein [Arcticibacter sp. MXS-1]|uniref:hypothetical protein n=1 Tax=Arcticibacter sp. MXS-1 TaxID=3341726 RepID=UPI0035A84310